MLTISRRGFLALGGTGAAGAALAACGSEEDPRDDGRDGELLAAALAAESGVEAAAEAQRGGTGLAPGLQPVLDLIAEQSTARLERLRMLAADAGAPDPEPVEEPPAGIDLRQPLNDAIVAYREAAGLLSSAESRRFASASLAGAAAGQAGLNVLDGDEASPRAFATGADQEPLTAPDATSAEEQDTETSTDQTTTEGG